MSDEVKTTKYQWQKTEKKAAQFVNCKRTPFSGSTSGLTHSDSLHDRLFLEMKTSKKHAVKTLYDKTKTLANKENKIPVLVLRETASKDTLWVLEERDLVKLLQEVDLNRVDERIKQGTTIYDLVGQQNTSNQDLYTVKGNLRHRLKEIFREKVLSDELLEELKSTAMLLDFVETIEDYIKEGIEK